MIMSVMVWPRTSVTWFWSRNMVPHHCLASRTCNIAIISLTPGSRKIHQLTLTCCRCILLSHQFHTTLNNIHQREWYLGCSSVLQIWTLASATNLALIPRFVNTFAQYRQLNVYAFRDESSSWEEEEGDSVCVEGDVLGVKKVGGGVLRISFMPHLLSSLSSSESLSLVSSSNNLGATTVAAGRTISGELSPPLVAVVVPRIEKVPDSLCRLHWSAMVVAILVWFRNSSILRLRVSRAEINIALVEFDSSFPCELELVLEVVVAVGRWEKGAGLGPPEKFRRIPVLALRSAENGPDDSLGVLGALERIVLIDSEEGDPELEGRRTVSGAGDIPNACSPQRV